MTGGLSEMYSSTQELPAHLRDWQLPPGWSWGADGLNTQHRHYQELIDALGRSLSLVSAPDEETLLVATRMRDTAFKRILGAAPPEAEGGAIGAEVGSP